MTEQEALYRAVLEDPDDDTVRLVYADWLDENDQPERAEFIRVQIALAKEPHCVNCGGKGYMGYGSFTATCRHCRPEFLRLKERQNALLTWQNIRTWFRSRGPVCDRYTAVGREYSDLRETVLQMGISAALVHRGFVSSLCSRVQDLFGNMCTFCVGRGKFQTSGSATECPRCSDSELGVGTGVTGGVLRLAFQNHPITAVSLIDRIPVPPDERYEFYNWVTLGSNGWYDDAGIPPLVENAVYLRQWEFPTAEDAHRGLSDACVSVGRWVTRLKERKS